jgi:UDPglucose--hexose-1-phosphate uridylyltransferase
VYKNTGPLAGTTLIHPHFQLLGLPLVPKTIRESMVSLSRHREMHGRCLLCDLIRQEERFPERIIAENEKYIAFCPYASRVPFETWIVPKTHVADFSLLDQGELGYFLRLQKDILRKIKRLLNNPSYHWILHSAPYAREGENKDFHWHIEILPQVYRLTGFEWGTEFFINPVSPEEAADALRSSHG